MREFTVMFRSVKEIGEFVSIANRQSFSVQLLYGSTVLDASSILSLCCLGLNRPLTAVNRARTSAAPFNPISLSLQTPDKLRQPRHIEPFRFIRLYQMKRKGDFLCENG